MLREQSLNSGHRRWLGFRLANLYMTLSSREVYEQRKNKILDRWKKLQDKRDHRKFIEQMMSG